MRAIYEQNGKLYHRFEGITPTRGKQNTLCFDHLRLQIKIPTASDKQDHSIVLPDPDDSQDSCGQIVNYQ